MRLFLSRTVVNRYPEYSVGRYMTPDYVAINPEMTAAEALEHIRKVGRGMETLNVIYILDEKLLPDRRLAASAPHELRGALRLARLHSMGEPHRSCHVWNAGGEHVTVHPWPFGVRPRRKLGSFRSHFSGCYRALHLFSRGARYPPGTLL